MKQLGVAAVLVGSVGLASASPSQATLALGTPSISGAVDAKAVAKVVKRSSKQLLACYKTALARDSGLHGAGTATFTIGANGKVAEVDAGGVALGFSSEVATCVEAVIAKLKFAKPRDGLPAEVRYTLTFDPGYAVGAFASLTGTGDIASGFDDTNIYGGLLGNEAGEMQGGWGYGTSGVGPGGGGTGWGIIGTGRYGVIGKGSGTGSGYGVGGGRGGMRGRSTAVPTIRIGQAVVAGDLDKAIIRRYVKRHLQRIHYCYEKELLATPKLQGKVTVAFTIEPDGKVSTSKASGLGNTTVELCMVQVVKSIEFPKPKGGGAVAVTYPFELRPADTTK